jgi:hypothetical protein
LGQAFLTAEVEVPSSHSLLRGRSSGNIGLAGGVLNELLRSGISPLSRRGHILDEKVEDVVKNQDEKNKYDESKHHLTSWNSRRVQSFPRLDPP